MKTGAFLPLSKKKEITLLNKTAQFAKSNAFSVKFIKACDESNKIAFAIRKKFGSAPARNTMKRRLRAILAQHKPKRPVYLLIIAKPNAMIYTFSEIKSELDAILNKIGQHPSIVINENCC